MIDKYVFKLASNTTNVGLKNRYSHKISLKNTTCGDKITIEIIADTKKIHSMKYETESCLYCEASASLLSQKINLKQFLRGLDLIALQRLNPQEKHLRWQMQKLALYQKQHMVIAHALI